MKKIPPSDLVPMDIFTSHEPLQIDLVYTQKDHPRNIFKAALYHPKARLWAHKDIAAITLLAARQLNKQFGYTLEIQDCLRTVDAQEAMQETDIVKAHPEWMKQPNRLLSPPGGGGHPRGMAIDVRVLDQDGSEVDMGTLFDSMEAASHRHYTDLPEEVLNNRKILENSFMEAAKIFDRPFLALPAEWWDFRFPHEHSYQFKPIQDRDLPPQMQMTEQVSNNIADLSQEHFDNLAEKILNIVDANI